MKKKENFSKLTGEVLSNMSIRKYKPNVLSSFTQDMLINPKKLDNNELSNKAIFSFMYNTNRDESLSSSIKAFISNYTSSKSIRENFLDKLNNVFTQTMGKHSNNEAKSEIQTFIQTARCFSLDKKYNDSISSTRSCIFNSKPKLTRVKTELSNFFKDKYTKNDAINKALIYSIPIKGKSLNRSRSCLNLSDDNNTTVSTVSRVNPSLSFFKVELGHFLKKDMSERNIRKTDKSVKKDFLQKSILHKMKENASLISNYNKCSLIRKRNGNWNRNIISSNRSENSVGFKREGEFLDNYNKISMEKKKNLNVKCNLFRTKMNLQKL